MKLNTRVENNILIVEMQGEFDLYVSPLFQEKMKESDLENVDAVIIDFSRVEYIDSSGLGAMVGLRKKLLLTDTPLLIAGANDSVKKIIHLTHLENLITTVADINAAIELIRP